jgi:hypothetical protein
VGFSEIISDFLESIKYAFPDQDWDKAHEEFRAAGEAHREG